jgi:predicted helicase
MPVLNLKPNHKPVLEYYKALHQTSGQMSLLHEGAVAPHFANLLRACAGRMDWMLAEQHQIPRKGRRPLRADGVFLDQFKLRHGVWEAKDTDDDLAREVKKKLGEGYPPDNILFQAPERAILVQNGRIVADEDITNPDNLVDVLKLFCEYLPPEYEQWDTAVNEFKDRVPELAQSLLALIETERKENKRFRDALTAFNGLMREAINPNISDQAVEEMLIQHLLTERIFRKVFNNPDFAQRNIIAREIEKVIEALTSRHFSRHDFLKSLDRFYGAIETTAATIEEFSEKQDFLNTVYENFFQGFSVKVADTHGIVYTPQPIVDFMVRSVDDILKREFGKTDGLASDGVAILDPFVGTGNFILRVMRQMPKSKLPDKYAGELFCNEVMLLPYYIASMNIEHDYYELTGRYQPFDGISLVDTFELAEGRQMPLFAPENTQRVQRQKNTPIFVVIGNPPYNAHQVNENDNTKNRTYRVLDERVSETYAKDSRATNKNALSDVYVKAIRWASDRIREEGVIAFVTNNSFIEGYSFDGMRKHLFQDFNSIFWEEMREKGLRLQIQMYLEFGLE